MGEPRDEHDDELNDAALGISRQKPEWRPSDGYREPDNDGKSWILLLGVFLTGVVSGVAVTIAATYL